MVKPDDFNGLRSVEIFGQRKMLPGNTAAIGIDVWDSGPNFGIYTRTRRVILSYRIINRLVLSHANTGVLKFQQYFSIEIPYEKELTLLGAEGERIRKDEVKHLQSILPALVEQLESDFKAGRVSLQSLKDTFKKRHRQKSILKLS